MPERRRVQRQSCTLDGRIFSPQLSDPVRCTITDISSLGAFVQSNRDRSIPANFDLSIGGSTLPRACRIARVEYNGFGVEFLDPVRCEVEEILRECAFNEELLFEALCPDLDSEVTITKTRLEKTTTALMDLIERRSAVKWQSSDIDEKPTQITLLTCL
ncbi:PilZ domain-containing protein [Methylobacterium sp. WL119]|nr:PilZ domain-containing protein [Methylobacterium sp. WL93]TXN47442.1 PilZ domain-containing protein [Methylobacterium sp. WL119]